MLVYLQYLLTDFTVFIYLITYFFICAHAHHTHILHICNIIYIYIHTHVCIDVHFLGMRIPGNGLSCGQVVLSPVESEKLQLESPSVWTLCVVLVVAFANSRYVNKMKDGGAVVKF